jgi:hypothetical protein
MARKKATVSLRKPAPAPEAMPEAELTGRETTPSVALTSNAAAPAAPEIMSIEAFVNGAAEALERAVGEVPQAKLLEMIERGPEGYRELTVYLPQQLARDLSLHCMQRDLDLNRLVAAALERHLGAAPSRLDKQRLAAVARALVLELAKRARRLLAARRPSWSAGRSAASAAAP